MSENIMRDKIISFVLWILVWWILLYSYTYFIWDKSWDNWIWWANWTRQMWNFDPSNMSDDQLERMAKRAWITKEELKSKLEAGESLRDIMPARNWSWSNFWWGRNQDSATWSWSN